jgi:hypothetical protein
VSAAIINIPMATAYGIIAFAPLGKEFIHQGVMAGLFSAVFAGLFASFVSGNPIQITGTTAPLTLIFASLVSSLVSLTTISNPAQLSAITVIGLASLCLLTAGISQVAFGALGIGNLIKYIPQPVTAGFMNGIALLLIIKQLNIIIGLAADQSLWLVLKRPDLTRDLYFLTKGSMSVRIHLHERDTQKRLFTYAPGTVFGEMSFLDGNPRSATVLASEKSFAKCLPYEQYRHLRREEPQIATKLMQNLALEISGRLRRTSNQVRMLEDS